MSLQQLRPDRVTILGGYYFALVEERNHYKWYRLGVEHLESGAVFMRLLDMVNRNGDEQRVEDALFGSSGMCGFCATAGCDECT